MPRICGSVWAAYPSTHLQLRTHLERCFLAQCLHELVQLLTRSSEDDDVHVYRCSDVSAHIDNVGAHQHSIPTSAFVARSQKTRAPSDRTTFGTRQRSLQAPNDNHGTGLLLEGGSIQMASSARRTLFTTPSVQSPTATYQPSLAARVITFTIGCIGV